MPRHPATRTMLWKGEHWEIHAPIAADDPTYGPAPSADPRVLVEVLRLTSGKKYRTWIHSARLEAAPDSDLVDAIERVLRAEQDPRV